MKKICFSSFILLLISMLFLPRSFSQNTLQWHLPEGVKARIGKGQANAIALSPDSTQLAVATGIGIWIYNTNTGVEIALLTGHTDQVASVAYSPDGRTLASGSSGEIRLWDPSTQEHKITFVGQEARSLAYSPDGQTLAAVRSQGVDLLNAQTGERKSFLSGHTYPVEALAFSADGKKLATATGSDEDKPIRLWNTHTGQLLQTLNGHTRYVHSLVFSPDNSTLASGGWDGTIRLWDPNTGEQTRTIKWWNVSLTYSPDGKRIAVGSGARLLLLDANTGKRQQTLFGHTSGIKSIVYSSDGSTLVSSSWDGSSRFWNAGTGSLRLTIDGHFNFRGTALSPNGKTIATVNQNQIFLWNTLNGRFVKVLDGYMGSAILAYSPDGTTLAAQVWDEGPQIHLLNAHTGQSKRILSWDGRLAASVAFSPNGKILASGSWGGTIRVWNTQNGKLHGILSGHTRGVNDLVFSPDGKTLASGSWDKTIRLWNHQRGQLQRTLEGHERGVKSLAFSPDGSTLASGSWDEIRFWDPHKGQLKQTFENARGEALVFSTDGQTLATGGGRVIHLRSVHTGEIQRALSAPPIDVAWLAFTPDGNTLVSKGSDQAILLWNMKGLPELIPEDLNLDGVVTVEDLITVASHFGRSVTEGVYPNSDVNGDGVVNRQDVLQIITLLEVAAGAPTAKSQTLGMLTAERLQHWINNAKQLNNTDEAFQKGIRVLEELLSTLTMETKATPIETAVLPNYPNPFNPETWIPYQLAKPAGVKITIYDAKGSVVRTLVLGHQPEGYYTEQQRAAYWDGRNTLGERVASGIYFYQLRADIVSQPRKMVILK